MRPAQAGRIDKWSCFDGLCIEGMNNWNFRNNLTAGCMESFYHCKFAVMIRLQAQVIGE